MTNDEFRAELRFYKNDIYLLGEVLDIPGITKCPNSVLVDGMCVVEAFFSIPVSICRYRSSLDLFSHA